MIDLTERVYGCPEVYDGYDSADANSSSTDGYVAFTTAVAYSTFQPQATYWLKASEDLYFWIGADNTDLVDMANSHAWRLDADRDYYLTVNGSTSKVFSWRAVSTSGVLFVAQMLPPR